MLKKSNALKMILIIILNINMSYAIASLTTITDNSLTPSKLSLPPKRLVKILSIDGGGVRGIIPAAILENLESRLPQNGRLAEYFDIISGTSAGGILALMLTVPDADGKPEYSASYIAEESLVLSKAAFSRSLWHILKSGSGWFDAKYDGEPLKANFQRYFQDKKLNQVVTNVVVPAYEIEQNKTFFFKSKRARTELSQDCYIRELAYATSAAPTYFRPAQLTDGIGKRVLTLIDGGVSVNNPTLAAAIHAVELYGTNIDLFVVSIGTGTKYRATKKRISYKDVRTSGMLGWAKEIVPLLMYSADAIVDYEMYYVLNFHKPQYYFRFQTILEPENSDMDNINQENVAALKKAAEDLIKNNEQELAYIVNVLKGGKYIMRQEEKPRLSFN